jgi:hypothetical protein
MPSHTYCRSTHWQVVPTRLPRHKAICVSGGTAPPDAFWLQDRAENELTGLSIGAPL